MGDDPSGGSGLPVGYNVVIDDSSMDTEGSIPMSDRKRVKPRKICRHCNKNVGRDGKPVSLHYCQCSESDCPIKFILSTVVDTNAGIVGANNGTNNVLNKIDNSVSNLKQQVVGSMKQQI